MPKYMTEESTLAGLAALSREEIGSGLLRNVGHGLMEHYRGRSEVLDIQIDAFEEARKVLERRVQQGHAISGAKVSFGVRAVMIRADIRNSTSPS